MKDDHPLVKIVTLTVAWIPLIYTGLLFISYMLLEGFFSRFNILAEYWLEGFPEPIRLSLPILRLLFVTATVLLYAIFCALYWIGNCKSKRLKLTGNTASGHYQKAYKLGSGKPAPTKRIITIAGLFLLIGTSEILVHTEIMTEVMRALIQSWSSFFMFLAGATILVSHEKTFLQGHPYASFLRNWSPLAIALVLYLFLGGALRYFGHLEAERVQRSKLQVALSLNNQPIELDSTTYYVRQTSKWIFFYKESVDSVLVYPMSNVTSIKFRGGFGMKSTDTPQ